jgi:integrase
MGPWQLQRAFRDARARVPGLPAGYRFHDLRHYYASALIASGLDIKTTHNRIRHATGKSTHNTYGRRFPDTEDATRAAISRVITARVVGYGGPSAVGLRSV